MNLLKGVKMEEVKMLKKIILLVVCLAVFLCGCQSIFSNENSSVTQVSQKEETSEQISSNEEISEPVKSEEPVLEVPEEEKLPMWKTEYLNFLKLQKENYESFALVFVDGDNIPELYLHGNCEAAGVAVCSYKNGRVIIQEMNRLGGACYTPKGGFMENFNGNMGYYSYNVYKLTATGFVNVFSGLMEEEIIDLENEEYDILYNYSIGDVFVSEEEFFTAAEAASNNSYMQPLDEKLVSYNTIRQQIINFK